MFERKRYELLGTSLNDRAFHFHRSGVKIDAGQIRQAHFSETVVLVYLTADTCLNSIENTIASKFFDGVPQLRAIYYHKEGDVIDVWSVLKDFDRSTREKVYAKEVALIKEFPDVIFNFRTTDGMGETTPASSGYRKITSKNLMRV